MNSIDTIRQLDTSDQQQAVIDKEFQQLLEAVHHGDLKTVKSKLEEYSTLKNYSNLIIKIINQTDEPQKNTLLHYAVAQHDLALIESLIRKGAEGTTPNKDGETAAEWYEEFIASVFNFERLLDAKELQTVIERNEVQVITDYLKGGITYSLRFSQGRTLLHWAVGLQQPAIVEVILEEISPENIPLLLKLKDSQGKTPLKLAQDLSQNGNPVSLEILSILQRKQRTSIPKYSVSISQSLLEEWLFPIDNDFKNKINELSNKLKNPITVADFPALNPLREVICKLAYMTCYQALARLVNGPTYSSSRKQEHLEEAFFPKLFGNWCDDTKFEFYEKLKAIKDYLDNLIQQQQINQMIHFSNELSHANGWHCSKENRIYLNPMAKKANLIRLVSALIHETTHRASHSYDFVTIDYSIVSKGHAIDFNQACQLASTGVDEKVTPEQTKLFKLRQLLRDGINSPDWHQQLNHWMALNNADTQTLAILLLATLPESYAQFDKKQQTLLIKPEFLSEKYFKKHPAPLPLTAPLPVPKPQVVTAQIASVDQPGPSRSGPTRRSFKNFFGLINPKKQQVASPCSLRSDLSNDSGERSTIASRTLSPSVQLPQAMAADIASAGQPEENPVTIPCSSGSDSDAGWSTGSRTPSPPTAQLQQSIAAHSPSANQPGRSRAGSTHRRSLASSISSLIPPGDRHSLASRTSRTTLIAPGYSSDNSD